MLYFNSTNGFTVIKFLRYRITTKNNTWLSHKINFFRTTRFCNYNTRDIYRQIKVKQKHQCVILTIKIKPSLLNKATG